MNTEHLKSGLNTEGAAVLYWVCLMIGVLMWTIGELTTTSHLREISRNVEELKSLVEQVREQTECVEMAQETDQKRNVSSQAHYREDREHPPRIDADSALPVCCAPIQHTWKKDAQYALIRFSAVAQLSSGADVSG